MMYPFMTLNDNTEIVHSEFKPDGRVKVYMETPDEKLGFKHATCYLPKYEWEDIQGYTEKDIQRFEEIIRSTAHGSLRQGQRKKLRSGMSTLVKQISFADAT